MSNTTFVSDEIVAPLVTTPQVASDADLTLVPGLGKNIVLGSLKFPLADGAPNQVLKTDGSAALSWADPAPARSGVGVGGEAVGGRLVATSPTLLTWDYYTSNKITLYNGSAWAAVVVATPPTAANTAQDMGGMALAIGTYYDVYAKYVSDTAFDLAFAPWAQSAADGANNPSTAYATVTNGTIFHVGFLSPGFAFDQNTTNAPQGSSYGPSTYIGYDFGAGNAKIINKYAICQHTSGRLTAWTIYGSNDNSTWTALHTGTNPGLTTGWTSYYTFCNSTPYRYYKIGSLTAYSGTTCYISELKFVEQAYVAPTRAAAWVTAHAYTVGHRVTSTNTYACVSAHTSRVPFGVLTSAELFALDLADGRWVAVSDLGVGARDGVPVYADTATYGGYRLLGTVLTADNGGVVNFTPTGISNFDLPVEVKGRDTLIPSGRLGIEVSTPSAYLHLPAGSGAAGSSPLKFTSGSLLANYEVGAVEFVNDKWFTTITTGTARKEIALTEGLTSGRVPFTTTDGRLTDLSTFLFATDTLAVPKITCPAMQGSMTLGSNSSSTITHTGRMIVRTLGSDPKHATPSSRPAGTVNEIAVYAGKMYLCTSTSTPTWELITSA